MTEFLSEEWIAALNGQLRASETGSSPNPLSIQYKISHGDDTIQYYLALGPEGDGAFAGAAESPDVTFRMHRDTAKLISDGELSTEEAFITGRLDIDGDPTPLIEAYQAANDA